VGPPPRPRAGSVRVHPDHRQCLDHLPEGRSRPSSRTSWLWAGSASRRSRRPRRIPPLRHHRREQPAAALAGPRSDVSEPAGGSRNDQGSADRRHDDLAGQHRSVLLLHGPDGDHRPSLGRASRVHAGGASGARARRDPAPTRWAAMETSLAVRVLSGGMNVALVLALAPLFEGFCARSRPRCNRARAAGLAALLRPAQAPRQGRHRVRRESAMQRFASWLSLAAI